MELIESKRYLIPEHESDNTNISGLSFGFFVDITEWMISAIYIYYIESS